MKINLANILNPTDLEVHLTDLEVHRKAIEEFASKLKELRQNRGKYLMLYNIKPWDRMRFIIGTKEDYQNAKINKDYEILLVDEI